jgi:type II secretory pathway pseudopilin PulG
MKKNQKGFSHVEVLLLTIIVGIIVAVGWYVWHSVSQANKNLSSADGTTNAAPSKKNSKQSTTNTVSGSPSKAATITPAAVPAAFVSSNPSYTTTTPTVVNNYITINEWKVKFKHNGVITIMYAHDANDKSSHAMFFSSTQIAGKNKACKAEFYPAGYIARFKSDEHVLDSKGSDTGKAAKDYVVGNSEQYKQVGDYYYFYRGPVGKCAELKEVEDLQNQTAGAVKAFLQSLEAVQA